MNRNKRKITKVYSDIVRFNESRPRRTVDFFKNTMAEGASSRPETHPTPPPKSRAVLQDIPQDMSQILANRKWQTMFLPEVGCFFLVFTRLEGRPWT